MIQEIRKHTTSLFFKIILIVVSISFVISFGTVLGDRKDVIARVNDKEILLKEYNRYYDQQYNALRQRVGERADEVANQINLRQTAFNQLVERQLLMVAANRIGITVTNEELGDFVSQQSYFQIDGKFSYETYQDLLRNANLTPEQYEDSLREDLLLQKYQRYLQAGILVGEEAIDHQYKNQFEKVKVDYLEFQGASFISEVEVTDEEVAAYYEANKNNYQTERQYQLEWFKLTLNDFMDQITLRDREVTRYYQKNLEQYTQKGEVKASHILFRSNPEDSEAKQVEIQQKAEEVRQEILGGLDFAEAAKQYSEDGSASNGGDLGWFKRGEMVPEFEGAAFSLRKGAVSPVVKSAFGWHIIKVEDRKEEVVKTEDEVRGEIENLLKENKAEKHLDAQYDRISNALKENGKLEELVKDFGTELKQTDWFAGGVVAGLGSVGTLTRQLQGKNTGEAASWKRNPLQGHVFYRITAVKEPEPKPLDEVVKTVTEDLKTEKATSLAKQKAQTALESMQQGESLSALAETLALEVKSVDVTVSSKRIPNLGNNEDFHQKALSLSDNNKFALSEADKKSWLLQFKQRNTEVNQSQKRQLRDRMVQQLNNEIINKEIERLKSTADVEVLNSFFQDPAAT